MVALFVVVSVTWVLFGLLAVWTMSGADSLRGVLSMVSGWRVAVFLAGVPTIGLAAVYGLRRTWAHRGWEKTTLWLASYLVVLVVMFAVAGLLWGVQSLAMLKWSSGLFFAFAVQLSIYGLTRRVGDERCCAKCGYPVSEEVGTVCPECGVDWSRWHGVTQGRVARSPWLVAAGVLLGLVALGLIFAPLSSRVLSPLTPTSLLLEQAAWGGVSTDAVWTELKTRALSEEQERELDERLLDLRLEQNRLGRQASSWLSRRAIAGELAPELLERYYTEMFDLHLESREMVDGRIRVEASADNRRTPFDVVDIRVIFGGFTVDGEPVSGSKMPEFASAYRFDPWSVSRKPGEELPGVVLAGGQGAVVEAHAWICFGAATSLTWGDAWGGSWGMPDKPAIPPAAAWVKEVKLRLKVEGE